MSISDAQYLTWLRGDRPRCVLAEINSYVSGTGVVTRYASNWPYASEPSDTPANQVYDNIVVGLPAFSTRMAEAFAGRSTFGWGDLELLNQNGDLDEWLGDGWDGRPFTLLLGDPEWPRADFRTIVAGALDDIAATARDRMTAKLRDKSGALNVSIQTSLIGGTTANAAQVKPLCFGQCFNVEPVLTIAASHTYQVHDGAINAISDVRDNGVSVAYTADLATGTFTLSAAPSGRITADVQGAKPSGTYLTKCADIVNHIVTTRTTLTSADVDAASVSAMNTTCAQTLGLYIRDRMNVMEAIDRLVTSVGGWWTFDRDGLLCFGRLDAPSGTPVLELVADDIEQGGIRIGQRFLPVANVRIGFATNWTPQPDGLAGAVTEANRALYAAPQQIASVTNSVTTKYLLAPTPEVEPTCLVSSSDAATEATRRASLRSVVRTVTSITAFASAHVVKLGDVVSLTHPRFSYGAGQLAVVVGITDRTLDNRIELDLWK